MINYIDNINKEDPKIFVALSPDYPNVGDIAINLAQNKILTDFFPNRKLINIPLLNFYNCKKEMQKIINNDDIITIIGGGNMGNVWIKCEEARRDLIKTFHNNKIISFPQSIDFESNELGQKEFFKTINIYADHPDLTVFSRDNRSYSIMKESFKNKVYLTPDIVMHLTNYKYNNGIKRDKISLCFRNDKEKITSQNIIPQFEELLKKNNIGEIQIFDTVIKGLQFNENEKKEIFDKTLEKFYHSKLVITDRLHGMIFSLITKTPCIALDNSNHKIFSTYHTWLENIPYIKVLDKFNEENVLNYIHDFQELDIDSISWDFSQDFEPLYQELKGGNK